MHARLTTDDNASELDRAATLATRDGIKGTIDSQLNTSLGMNVRALLVDRLGADAYERILLDLANNVVQALL